MDRNARFQECTAEGGVLSLRSKVWREVRASPLQRTRKDDGGSQESQRKEKSPVSEPVFVLAGGAPEKISGGFS